MTGLYLFAAAAGLPLVLWFVFSAGADGGDGGDGWAADGVAGVMFRLLPLSTLAFGAATFGVCGLVLGAVGNGQGTTLVAAGLAGAAAGAVNSSVFAYLRRSSSTSGMRDDQLAGAMGRVVVPMAAGRRGRVSVGVAGQQVYLSATPLAGTTPDLEMGDPVLVVEVRNGIATVTRLDPELT